MLCDAKYNFSRGLRTDPLWPFCQPYISIFGPQDKFILIEVCNWGDDMDEITYKAP